MWWSRLLLMAGLVALGPVGCGFEPMYAKRGAETAPVMAELTTIRVMGIEDRSGQILRNALVNRLNPRGEPAHSAYILTVRLTNNQENLAERNDGKASLGRMFVRANFRLVDVEQEIPIMAGTSQSVVSYRLLGPTYGSTAVERDAEQRALIDISEDIRTQLATFFSTGKQPRGLERGLEK